MKFVLVPGTEVLFCIHQTRKGDYGKYAEANKGLDTSWQKVEYEGVPVSEGEDHPVVMVSWEEAHAYSAWLSKQDGKKYRLPTDHEWSLAVGIGDREDPKASPQEKHAKIKSVYPWGTKWPPPKGAGNFADESAKRRFANWTVIEGYDDGYVTTSPVLKFDPNPLGLYDMAGNVWEWCEDWYDSEKKYRVLRGGSWGLSDRDLLLSSYRFGGIPARRRADFGFRVVLER
jgi:formylglycine-generating enzyme required for sulfatase activity